MEVETFYNNKGKVVGHLKNSTYFKRVDSRRHKLRNGNAYGIDSLVLKKLVARKCNKIRLLEVDTERIYEVDLDTFMGSKSFVRNYDSQQRFLPISNWVLEDKSLKLF